MAGATVETQGFDTLASTLNGAGRELKSMPEANAKAGDVIASAARSRAPRRTGALAATVRAAPDRDGSTITAGEPPRVGYALFVEYGTGNMRAEPYMWPAIEESQGKWLKEYQSSVDETLGKVHGA
jgi:HK97 gp10 family phage protein